MRRVFRHIAVAALLFAALPLRAQWSGGLDLAGGYGWMPPFAEGYDPLNHALGQGGGRVMLRKPTLRWETRLNEFFDFRAIRIEPYFAADWGWRTWRAHVDYAVQLYTRRLTDDTHRQELGRLKPYLTGNAFLSWQPSPKHRVILRNTLSVRHPDYVQTCWYDRQAGYLTQVYRGNENLQGVDTRTWRLDYEFRYGGFQSTTALTYTRRFNEIDQTFFKETIDGREYKVFTWLNSADGLTTGVLEQLGWQGEVLSFQAGVNYTGTKRVARASGKEKLTTEWRAWEPNGISDMAVFCYLCTR